MARRLDPGLAGRLRRRRPWARILLAPFLVRRRDVERVGEHQLRRRRAGGTCSTSTAIAPIRRAARRSSTSTAARSAAAEEPGGASPPLPAREPGVGVHQRELPAASGRKFPDHLIDVKKVIAWVREHGPEYGADPAGRVRGGQLRRRPPGGAGRPHARTTLCSSPDSSGGHLGHRRDLPVRLLRPRRRPRSAPSSPLAYVRADAPPFFVAHGDQDTLVLVEGARRFVERLRRASAIRRLRRAARRAARVRPVPLHPLRGGRRCVEAFAAGCG